MNTESSEIKHHSGNWIGGAVLIGLGIIFLLQNFMNISLANWWALFIMIPAIGALGEPGRPTMKVEVNLIPLSAAR
jgi:hypothetical protein